MKITPLYETRVIVIPGTEVLPKLSTASREELAVLFAVMAQPEFIPAELAAQLNITEKVLIDAISMWQRSGVLAVSEESETSSKAVRVTEPVKKTVPKNIKTRKELPHYSSSDAADYLEKHAEVKNLVDCCQNISGEMFSTAETEIIIGMHDYLALPPDYIMLLFAHAQKTGKRSVRYVESLAIRFFDEGVLNYQELEERLKIVEKLDTTESYIRSIFGLTTRALTAKEKAMVEKWVMTMRYEKDILRRAYEITVDNTGKPSLPYANAILENWYQAGLKSIEEIDAAMEDYKKAHESTLDNGGSFNTDDFFEAALRRSYDT